MTTIYESDIEELAIELLRQQGYTYIAPDQQETERDSTAEVILKPRLQQAIHDLNPNLPEMVKTQAMRQVTDLPSAQAAETNANFYNMLIEGVAEEYQQNNNTVGARLRLIDFENAANNDFAVCNQFSVKENRTTRRPDVVLFVNGLPMGVIELKNPADEKAGVHSAFVQLQNYKNSIPTLFRYNGILVASDGLDAQAGSLTAGEARFMAWKTVDGTFEDPATTPQLETLIKGMLRPAVLLDLIRYFTVFETIGREDPKTGTIATEKEKKIAAYHQYHAVKKAVISTIRAAGVAPQPATPQIGSVTPQPTTAPPQPAPPATEAHEDPEAYGLPGVKSQPAGDRKAGVVWHTQGSGKSLSMLFYAGLLVIDRRMANPTIVIITDRNNLDGQLFDAFTAGKDLLRQEPARAKNRQHLKKLLTTLGGGVVFSTIQKFSPEDDSEEFDVLSDRENIVVIADEAHRSQYGFGAKTHFVKDGAKTRYGFAKYLRDALPRASFVGFTGTPIEKDDASTPAVFGNYIDIYDIEQAVKDGATVPIYYESRLARVHLKEEYTEELDAEIEEIVENRELDDAERAKAKSARQEAIIGHEDRRRTVVADILQHFAERRDACQGKAMIVTTSRRIAVAMYADIISLRPHWHNQNTDKGAVKIVMTSSSSDPPEWQQHSTTKDEKTAIRKRFIIPEDSLQMVIVCDMWLTGFDAPCLDTLYIDKIMSGHNLMQAIARVNRVYKDKAGGLIVDYIGIASNLKRALAAYTQNGGRGSPALKQEDAVKLMLEKYDVAAHLLAGFNYKPYFTADTAGKLRIILEAQEHILSPENDRERFSQAVYLLARAFAMSVPSAAAMNIKAEVGFFQAVRARLIKFGPTGSGKSTVEMETAIRQIVDKALAADGVIDIFDAAGIKKPDVSILSDNFLAEIRGMRHKNLALALLKKILNNEIRSRSKKNLTQGRKFSEMLETALKKYRNRTIEAAEIIQELIDIAKEIRESEQRGADLGLSDNEIAFYDALADNGSAREMIGNEKLRTIAQLLTDMVKRSVSIDWTIKESVRARLRTMVKRLLNKYGYPPDLQKSATELVIEQAELFADDWTN
ncbi:MAG: type I restriction endonuclease subunit R [Salinispira sp.]